MLKRLKFRSSKLARKLEFKTLWEKNWKYKPSNEEKTSRIPEAKFSAAQIFFAVVGCLRPRNFAFENLMALLGYSDSESTAQGNLTKLSRFNSRLTEHCCCFSSYRDWRKPATCLKISFGSLTISLRNSFRLWVLPKAVDMRARIVFW